jgi:hypothetical protein
MRTGYKEVYGSIYGREQSRVRDASLPGDMLGIELSWQLQTNRKKAISRLKEGFMCDLK